MKKLAISVMSSLTEFILFGRNHSWKEVEQKLEDAQHGIDRMNQNNIFSMETFSTLLERQQYCISKKASQKEYRMLNEISILIKFKLADKHSSNVSAVESWLVSTARRHPIQYQAEPNYDQEAVSLLGQVVRALRCQFLSMFSSGSQQLKNKYILDYEISFNPSKSALRELSLLNYKESWKRSAKIDLQSILSVSCYHSQHAKIKTIIEGNRKSDCRYRFSHKYLKHGSEETKPSLSDEIDLDSSNQSGQARPRVSSVIQFYDDDLNITVLSNDSGSFKKSTGKIEGVYISKTVSGRDIEEPKSQLEEEDVDSDGQFQLLIEESTITQQTADKADKFVEIIKCLDKDCFGLLEDISKVSQDYFNL